MSTSSRLLRLLSLLQTPRDWTGSELASRLEVSPRTVRNDIERLRDLGYPVHATRGSIGGDPPEAGGPDAPPPLPGREGGGPGGARGPRDRARGRGGGGEAPPRPPRR